MRVQEPSLSSWPHSGQMNIACADYIVTGNGGEFIRTQRKAWEAVRQGPAHHRFKRQLRALETPAHLSHNTFPTLPGVPFAPSSN